jgi:hypothetical protein
MQGRHIFGRTRSAAVMVAKGSRSSTVAAECAGVISPTESPFVDDAESRRRIRESEQSLNNFRIPHELLTLACILTRPRL